MDNKNNDKELKAEELTNDELEQVTGGILDSATLNSVNEAGFMENK